MSLIKKPEMTEANRAAHRANGRKSHGARTPQGKERARAANLRHGYYSDIRDEAIVALGEDPAKLRRLIDSAYEEWRPQGDYRSALVERSARLLWRMDRAERIQESLAVERVETLSEIKSGLTAHAHGRYLQMVDMLDLVYLLAGRPDFYATPHQLRDFSTAMGQPMGSLVQDMLKLLLQLRKPAKFPARAKTLPEDEPVADDEVWQDYLAEEAQEVVTDLSLPVPDQPIAEGEEREPLRLNLRALARELAHDFRHDRSMRKAAGILSDMDRDVMWGKAQQDRALMRREEESCFREFWRLTKILTGMQERRPELGRNERNSAADSGSKIADSGIPDSAVGGGPPQRRASGSAAPRSKSAGKSAKARAAGAEQRSASRQRTVSPGASRPAQIKNAGASGDVDENTRQAFGSAGTESQAEGTKGR